MKNNDEKIRDRIERVKDNSVRTNFDDHYSQMNQPEHDEQYLDTEETRINQLNEETSKDNQIRSSKLLKTFGVFALTMSILAYIFTGSTAVDTSAPAREALTNQTSLEVSSGVVLLGSDEELAAQDHTIVHQSNEEETKIWVWDYAAEDGDYVQVLVNGTPISEPFMIKHKPREFMVPAVGTVEIKGIRDGGGGITYAVRYEINGTSYFNSAPIGGQNTYELIRE